MVVAKTAIGDGSGVVALVAARADERCLFLRWSGENCAGLAPWRTDPNVVQGANSLLNIRPGCASGMGSLRRELRFAFHRFAGRAVSSLAPYPPSGLLRGGHFSSFERADLSSRHLPVARHRGDDSFSFAEPAASETNPDSRFRDTLRCDPDFSTAAPLPLFRRHRMDLHGAPLQLANDARTSLHAHIILRRRSQHRPRDPSR